MTEQSFIFGKGTPWTYEQLQRKREIADALANQIGTPRNVGEGLAAIGKALAARGINKQADARDAELKGEFDQTWSGAFGGGMPGMGGMPGAASGGSFAPPDPNSPSQIGADTMAALGKAPDYAKLETTYGLPQGYLARTAQIESGGNPNAQNPNSSAGGAFQFIDSTARQYGLTDKTDPIASADAAARLARDNKAALTRALGREPTAGELYLAHQQGAQGAASLILNQNAPAAGIVGQDAVALNGGSASMTGGQFANKWLAKFGGQPQAPQMDIGMLAQLAGSPYASPAQKTIASALLQQQMQAMTPQKPIEVGGVLLDPTDYHTLFDSRTKPDGGNKTLDDRKALAEAGGLQPGTPEYQQFLLTGNTVGRGANEYGLVPQIGRDKDGNPVMLQPGKDGTAVATKLPDGITFAPDEKAFQTASGSAAGKVAGEAAANLGAEEASAKLLNGQIDAVLSDPKLDSMVGPFDAWRPNISGAANTFQARLDQIKGSLFMQAYQSLKGGGQITEIEGQKATDAMARLNTAQNEKDFRQALNDIRDVVNVGLERMKSQANYSPGGQQAPAAPQGNTVIDGYTITPVQ